jgi:AcrR family transcriptional regulator
MASRQKAKSTAADIREAYIRYLLTEGKRPATVFAFAERLGMTEAEFYQSYSSFDALEESVWSDFMESTLSRLQGDENYATFSAREKLLAFMFTHLEVLLAQRSYVAMKWPGFKQSLRTPAELKDYRERFKAFAKELVSEGIEKGELKERARLSERYDEVFWLQLGFVIDYWCHDNSKGFEQTDAAIEKAVNLSFQLLSETALDSAIDFAKFLLQKR